MKGIFAVFALSVSKVIKKTIVQGIRRKFIESPHVEKGFVPHMICSLLYLSKIL